MDKLSYALGMNIGQQLNGMGMNGKLVVEDYCNAIADVLSGREPKMSYEEAHGLLSVFFDQLEKEQRAAEAEKG